METSAESNNHLIHIFSPLPIISSFSLKFVVVVVLIEIVDVQCCIKFCYTEKWFSYIYIFFFIFFSIMAYHRIVNIVFPMLYSRILLFIHSIYSSLHLLIPNSQSFPPLLPPLGNHKSRFIFSTCCLTKYYDSFWSVTISLHRFQCILDGLFIRSASCILRFRSDSSWSKRVMYRGEAGKTPLRKKAWEELRGIHWLDEAAGGGQVPPLRSLIRPIPSSKTDSCVCMVCRRHSGSGIWPAVPRRMLDLHGPGSKRKKESIVSW